MGFPSVLSLGRGVRRTAGGAASQIRRHPV